MKTPKNKYNGKRWIGTALVVVAALVAALFLGCKQEADPVPTYTVTFDLNGGIGTVPATQTVESGKTATKPADPDRTGYTFSGWFKDNTRYDFNTAVTGDLSLTAKWIEDIAGFAVVVGSTITGSGKAGVFVDGRTVTLGDFWMSDHEVTQDEYAEYMTPAQEYDKGKGVNHPAYYVSWYDAIVYCNKRSMDGGLTPCYSISGSTDPAGWGEMPTDDNSPTMAAWDAVTCDWDANGYRLPTEAEWEYAARGGDQSKAAWNYTYAGTNEEPELENYAWYNNNSDSKTHEVKKKAANALGLYDMSGNVWEWCWDWGSAISDATPATGAVSGSLRGRRGGSWVQSAASHTVSIRDGGAPFYRYNNYGFRVVRTAK